MHGGAGALISIGLLKALPFESFEACVLQQHDSGGDAFLTSCLWQVRLFAPANIDTPHFLCLRVSSNRYILDPISILSSVPFAAQCWNDQP